MREERLRTALKVREGEMNYTGILVIINMNTGHYYKQKLTKLETFCIYLYSVIEACVWPSSHCDILTHSRRAAFNRSMKSTQHRGIFHLIEHTQSRNA